MGRRLLEEAEDVEYEGLAELSGCNCNMIVTLTEHEDADYKEKNKELKFYKESPPLRPELLPRRRRSRRRLHHDQS